MHSRWAFPQTRALCSCLILAAATEPPCSSPEGARCARSRRSRRRTRATPATRSSLGDRLVATKRSFAITQCLLAPSKQRSPFGRRRRFRPTQVQRSQCVGMLPFELHPAGVEPLSVKRKPPRRREPRVGVRGRPSRRGGRVQAAQRACPRDERSSPFSRRANPDAPICTLEPPELRPEPVQPHGQTHVPAGLS